MNRREFTCALASTALPLSAHQAAGPPVPKKAKITSSVMLWTLKGTFEQKVEIAAKAGLQSLELVTEHVGWSDADIAARRKFVASYGLAMDTILGQPDWGKRPVSMVDPAHRAGFLKDVESALVWAKKLEIPQVILMSGNEIAGRTRDAQYASMLEGSKRAADLAAKAGIRLIVEPLNAKVDHKGYYLATCAEGLKLVKEVDNPHFRLLFDLYHEQVQVGDPTKLAVEAMPFVSVYHVADAPGRNDPGTGQMNYSEIYKAIAKAGYSGIICMEYVPKAAPVPSLIAALDQMRTGVAG